MATRKPSPPPAPNADDAPSFPKATATEDQQPVDMVQWAYGLLTEVGETSNVMNNPIPSYSPPVEDLANPFAPDAPVTPVIASITGAATADNAFADGVALNTATFTALDAEGAPCTGVELALSSDSVTALLSTTAAQTDANGQVVVNVSNTVAETVTVTADSSVVPPATATGSQALVFVAPVGTEAAAEPAPEPAP